MRAWRFVTLLLVALAMAMAFAHLLEMPAKRGFDLELYRVVNQSLYRAFGTFGAAIEVGAVLSSVVLAFVVRARRPAFALTLAAAVLVVAAHLVFWVLIAPANALIAEWTPGDVPAIWTSVRDRWEWSHATRAVLMVVAFGLLLASVLAETPSSEAPGTELPVESDIAPRIALLRRRPTG